LQSEILEILFRHISCEEKGEKLKKTSRNRIKGETQGAKTMKNDEVLTTNEAIRYLKISRPTFLKYIHIGRIRATRAGNGWRVLESELHRFLRGEEN